MALALLILSCWSSWQLTGSRPGFDYYPIWAVVRWVRAGGDPHIRGLEAQRRLGAYAFDMSVAGPAGLREKLAAEKNLELYDGRLEPYATPFLYAFLGLAMTDGYERDYLLFSLGSILAHAAAAFFFAVALGLSLPHSLLASAALALPFAPFWSYLVTGNVGAIQSAFLLSSLALLYWKGRPLHDVFAGFLFALAVLIKPVIGPAAFFMAIPWVISRDRGLAARMLLGAAAGALIGWALGCSFFGSLGAWGEWYADLSAMLRSTRPIDPYNCSPLTALRAHWGGSMAGLSLPVVVSVTLWISWNSRRRANISLRRATRRRTARVAAIGCGVALLISPYSWLHYYLMATPLVLTLVAAAAGPLRSRVAQRWFLPVLAAALGLASTPLHRSGVPLVVAELWLANVALVTLVALGLVLDGAEDVEDSGHKDFSGAP